jgi:hypothetical protein
VFFLCSSSSPEVSVEALLGTVYSESHCHSHQCLKPGAETSKGALSQACAPVALDLSLLILRFYIVDGNGNQPQSPPTSRALESSEEEPDYSSSSWTLYSMYSKIAEDEDNKMLERCQRDADGTLIFVSPHVSCKRTPHVNWET